MLFFFNGGIKFIVYCLYFFKEMFCFIFNFFFGYFSVLYGLQFSGELGVLKLFFNDFFCSFVWEIILEYYYFCYLLIWGFG